MHCLSRSRRTSRSGEWTWGKAVTFTVTLAATGSVTLAATAAGMSRKSAYALKVRDSAFAAWWNAAVAASARLPVEADKVDEVEEPFIPPRQGDRAPRDLAFAGLLAKLRDMPPLARCEPCQ